ncbi:XRE family transcriptional regulator [Photobacterium phosphoreum]|uniref:XRE family transcriptional regulator n=1 Tax=Photobacterium phosphoreum TaxID=659 RepID=UPI000D15F7FE|nr:XRE family transcriptional regulator [Photobacterium phosphoreum]PTB33063.1 DNA-binding protein [Photobacterium phosphoreum]
MNLFNFNNENEYFRGDKLRIARMAKMLSMEELATRIGKTKQFICKLEKGYEPSQEVLESLSGALDITKRFLYSERDSHIETEKCHFRSLKTRTKTVTLSVKYRVEILSSVIKKLEQEVELPETDLPDVSGFDLSRFSDIERLSESVRDYWDIGLGPISNITELLENLGIIITSTKGSDGKVDAFSVPNARPLIILDNTHASSCRNRFTLAHELGHLLFHDEVITGDSQTESQADYFASSFLLPRASFINEFPCSGAGRFDWDAMVEFKKRWKVSLKAIVYRASSLGLISQAKAKTAYMHLNTKGYVYTELGDEFLSDETSSVLSQMVNLIELSTWREILSTQGISEKLFYNLYGIKHDHSTLYAKPSLRLVH